MDKSYWSITRSTAAKLIVVLSGVLFFVVLSHLSECAALFHDLMAILRPFLIGLALAYILDPMARALEKRRVPRRWAVLASCLTGLVLVSAVLILALPQFFRSLKALGSSVPFYFSQMQQLIAWAEGRYGFDASPLVDFMGSYVELFSDTLRFAAAHIPQMLHYGRSVADMFIHLFTGVVFAVYVLMDKANLMRQCRKVIWALCSRRVALRLFHISETAGQMLRGFIGGKILDSMVVWFICLLSTALLGIPYYTLFSLVVGVTNMVPVFGPIAGGVFCCLLLLVLNPMKAVIFAILILVLQQIDGKIIGPLILGDATGLKTFWVLVAILVGGKVAGAPGMVLGVPAFATIYALVREFLNASLLRKGINYRGEPLEEGSSEVEPPAPGSEPLSLALFHDTMETVRSHRRARSGSYMEVSLREDDTLTDIWGSQEPPADSAEPGLGAGAEKAAVCPNPDKKEQRQEAP